MATPMVGGMNPTLETFKQLYTTAPHDFGTIARQLNHFIVDPLVHHPMGAHELLSSLSTLTTQGRCSTLLMATSDGGRHSVQVIHAPALCPTLMDTAQHQWMGRFFVGMKEVYNKELETY